MGLPGMPWYGAIDLGSAIETAKKVIAKIETNVYDKADLVELETALSEIKKAIDETED